MDGTHCGRAGDVLTCGWRRRCAAGGAGRTDCLQLRGYVVADSCSARLVQPCLRVNYIWYEVKLFFGLAPPLPPSNKSRCATARRGRLIKS
jgi:hypothetical protein